MDFNSIMSTVLDPILNAGPLFMIFCVFTIIGLVVGLGIVKAIRNGLMIAVGFQGVYIVVDYFLAQVAPAAEALAERFGGVFTYTDIGWAAFASFAWSSPLAYAVVVISLGVNLVMIFTNMTDTLNLNIWDTWEASIATLIIYGITGNAAAGLVFSGILAWVNLMVSDWYANKGYCSDYGFDGISFYQGTNVSWGIFAHYIARLLDKIPATSNATFTPEYVQEKFGVIGEPAVLGGIIGLLMGLAAGFYWTSIILLMISLATALVLLPMMSGIVMQALVPVSEAAAKFMKEKTNGKELYIGVDPAIAVGSPTVLATTILMVPVLLIFAFIIPGTVNVPLADLPALLFFWVFVAAPNRFDMLRTFVTTILMGIIGTLVSIVVAPWLSMVAVNQGVEVVEGTGVTSWFGHLTPEFLFAGLVGEGFGSLGMVGLFVIAAVVVVVTGFLRVRYVKNRAATTAEVAAD
jgi:PTS system galactitol-specific IIC component